MSDRWASVLAAEDNARARAKRILKRYKQKLIANIGVDQLATN